MVPSVRHFESLTLWIQLRPGLRGRAWEVMKGHSRKLTKLSMTIFSKFWSRDCYPICIHGSRPRCFTCIAEQNCSTCFSGQAALGLSFCEHKHRNGQICPFRLEDIILLTLDPGRVISNHRDSSRVGSCQLSSLARWISPIPLRLIILISTDHIPPLLTKYGVYNAVKCLNRNK